VTIVSAAAIGAPTISRTAVMSATSESHDASGRGFAETLDGVESERDEQQKATPQTESENAANSEVSSGKPELLAAKFPAGVAGRFPAFTTIGRQPGSKPTAGNNSVPQRKTQNDTAVAPVAVPIPPEPLLPMALPLETDILPASEAAPQAATEIPPKPETPPPAAGPVISGAPAANADLAFAARVTPAQAAAETSTNARSSQEAQASATAASNLRKAAAAADDAQQPTPQPVPSAANVAVAYETSARTAEPTAPPAPQSPAPAAQTAPSEPAIPTHTTTPLRDISLHVSQPGSERVEVRVVQQAGEVRVAVRTGDSELASGLRQGVHELAGKLEDSGYRAETWRPASTSAAAAPVAAAESHGSSMQPQSQSQQQSQQGNSQGRQNGSQQQNGQRNQNPSNRPRWVEELETSVHSGQSTGDTNGNSN
jgi:hypothetical protein